MLPNSQRVLCPMILYNDTDLDRGCPLMTIMCASARFSVGELVYHRLFHYRGVVIDVDPEFQSTEEWYELVARSRPPKDQPWYRVLVHNATHQTYVAERNLEKDETEDAIVHPLIDEIFTTFYEGRYGTGDRSN